MANKKSSIKDIRRITKRSAHNRHIRSRLKTLRKHMDQALAKPDSDEAAKAVADYISALDKAAKRGIIHHNKANRHKSGCALKLAGKSETVAEA